MKDPKQSFSVELNEAQRNYLERLGLTTLLTDKFGPSLRMFWAKVIEHRTAIAFGSLVAALVVICVLWGGLNHSLKQRLSLQKSVGKSVATITNLEKRNAHLEISRAQTFTKFIDLHRRVARAELIAQLPASSSGNKRDTDALIVQLVKDDVANGCDFTKRFGKYAASYCHRLAKIGAPVEAYLVAVNNGADINAQAHAQIRRTGKPSGQLDGFTVLQAVVHNCDFGVAADLVRAFPEINLAQRNRGGMDVDEQILKIISQLDQAGENSTLCDFQLGILNDLHDVISKTMNLESRRTDCAPSRAAFILSRKDQPHQQPLNRYRGSQE